MGCLNYWKTKQSKWRWEYANDANTAEESGDENKLLSFVSDLITFSHSARGQRRVTEVFKLANKCVDLIETATPQK